MHFMQTESVLQTKNQSEPAKNQFSVTLLLRYKTKKMFFFQHFWSRWTGTLKNLLKA